MHYMLIRSILAAIKNSTFVAKPCSIALQPHAIVANIYTDLTCDLSLKRPHKGALNIEAVQNADCKNPITLRSSIAV